MIGRFRRGGVEARREGRSLALAVGGRMYALGVDWRGVSPNPRGAARAAARAEDGVPAVRVEAGQYGLGPAAFRGLPSGAAALADAGEGAWIGVWPLPEREEWWGVAVSGRQIYPGFGDAVLDGEDAAWAWFEAHLGVTEWVRVFAPEGWAEGLPGLGAGGADPLDVEAALEGRSGARLGGERSAAGGVVAVALGAAVAGGSWWLLSPAAPPPVYAPPPELRASVPPPAAPAGAFAARCQRLLDGLYARGFPAGWEWTAAECSVSGGRLAARLEGRARPWLAVATAAPGNPPGMAVNFRARTAVAVADPAGLAVAARAPGDAGALVARLARVAEGLGGALGRGLETTEEAAAHDPERERRPDWRWLGWTLDTAAPFSVWSGGLEGAGVAGVVSARLDLELGVWRVRGRAPVRGGAGG